MQQDNDLKQQLQLGMSQINKMKLLKLSSHQESGFYGYILSPK